MGEKGRAGQREVSSGREQGESTSQYGVGKGLIKKRSEQRLEEVRERTTQVGTSIPGPAELCPEAGPRSVSGETGGPGAE